MKPLNITRQGCPYHECREDITPDNSQGFIVNEVMFWDECMHDHNCNRECSLTDVDMSECPLFKYEQVRTDEACCACENRMMFISDELEKMVCANCGEIY